MVCNRNAHFSLVGRACLEVDEKEKLENGDVARNSVSSIVVAGWDPRHGSAVRYWMRTYKYSILGNGFLLVVHRRRNEDVGSLERGE